MYTLGGAARATGLTRQGLLKAIKTGRISATRNDLGVYQIDPAELHRVYPPAPVLDQEEPPDDEALPGHGSLDYDGSDEPDLQLVRVQGDAEKWQAIAEERQGMIRDLRETVRDLRARLDRETERVLLLPPPVTAPGSGSGLPRLPWWKRLVT